MSAKPERLVNLQKCPICEAQIHLASIAGSTQIKSALSKHQAHAMRAAYEETVFLPPGALAGKNRRRSLGFHRRVLYVILRYHYQWTLEAIADFFGRHHAAVMKSLKQADRGTRSAAEAWLKLWKQSRQ